MSNDQQRAENILNAMKDQIMQKIKKFARIIKAFMILSILIFNISFSQITVKRSAS